jgi:hypothetical protein
MAIKSRLEVEINMADETKVYPSGLTEKEAEEIQGGLMWGTRIYAAIAILAHILAYMLTPWLK